MKNLNEDKTHVMIRGFWEPLKDFTVGAVVESREGEWFGHITGVSFEEIWNHDTTLHTSKTLQLKVLWMDGKEESNVEFADIKLL